MSETETPVCIVHFDQDGDQKFSIFGNARMLIIDERAPNDRVYAILGSSIVCLYLNGGTIILGPAVAKTGGESA